MEGNVEMGWFNKNKSKNDFNKPSEMSPIESVTHLCTAIQLSDGQIDHEEKNVWITLVSDLFPDFSKDRADRFFIEAQLLYNKKNSQEKLLYIVEVLKRIKELLDKNQIKSLGQKISNLIESDGIVMSGEIEIAKIIEENLEIEISIDKNI